MKIQPVVVVSPWVWLLIRFWKPLLVAFLVFVVLLYAVLAVGTPLAIDSARRHDAAVPTMAIPQTWQDSLTQAARP
jgi:hypothetical protein